MAPHRILSLDGGVGATTYLRAVREIERARPGFLSRVDSFAGASDGTTASAFLAMAPASQRNIEWADRAIELCEKVLRTMEPGIWNWVRLLSTVRALTDGEDIMEIFKEVYRDKRLRELPGKVTLVTYRVRDEANVYVFHNYGDSPSNPLVREAVIESGSFPVVFPIADGHVDGGLFANNPSAIAVAQVLSPNHGDTRQAGDIHCLSLGYQTGKLGGRWVQSEFQKPRTDWGMFQWMLCPTDPLLFFQALFNSGDRSASWTCQRTLGPRFLRVDMPALWGVISGVPAVMLGQAQRVFDHAENAVRYWVEHPDEPSIRPTFNHTLEWVDRFWMKDDAASGELLEMKRR